MTTNIEFLKGLNETRAHVWEEAKRLLDDVAKEKRELSGEENAQWERYNARLDEIDQQIRTISAREESESAAAITREALEKQFGTHAVETNERTADQRFRDWAAGNERRNEGDEPGKNAISIDLTRVQKEQELIRQGASADELRALAWDTGSIASGVPTTMARELYQLVTASIALMRMPTYKFTTASGEQMKFPKINAHGIATQVSGQGTTLAGTDATFLSMTLDAYKYAELYKVANEVLQDTIFDVAGFLAGNVGRAVGEVIGTDLAVGSGSGKPNGVMTAITGSGTVATGGSLITPTYENLVDLVYSVNGNYRSRNSAAWLMKDTTAGTLRKLRDGAGGTVGAVLWEPSLTQGIQGAEPGLLMGYPVWTDPNIASLASNNKVIAFGDFSAYYIRQVGSFVFERDDSRYFDTDEVGFRGKWRVDGDLIDTTAINILKQSV